MAITPKPKPQIPATASGVNIDALIAKGGSVAQDGVTSSEDSAPESKPISAFTLRVPTDILTTLDDHRKKGAYKVPRQLWILEAIVQRLEREVTPGQQK